VKTPHLDALAAEGTAFLSHFAQAAPCSPARASLYTGLYQMNHRVCRNGSPLAERFDNVAHAARRGGYEPTLFGYTDQSADPTGRDPRDPVLTTYEGVLPGFYPRVWLPEHEKPWLSWLRAQGLELVDAEHAHRPVGATAGSVGNAPPAYSAEQTQTAFLAGEFIRWLGEQDKGRSWFAHVSCLRPHPPFIVPEPYNTMFDPGEVDDPIRPGNEAHPLLDFAYATTRKGSFVPGAEGLVRDFTPAELRQIKATYFGMIAEVDAQIGRILRAVRAYGHWDDTIVVFTSDHAEMLGDHGMLGKGGYFDQSQHVPLIIRVPGVAPSRIEGFTESVDVFPTLLELTGVAPAHVPDGRSLLPLMRSDAQDGRDSVHWEFDFRDVSGQEAERRFGLPSTQLNLAVIRTTRWKYVHFAALPPLLFDLEADPQELHDLAGDPRHLPVRLEMAERLLAWRAEHLDQTLALQELTPAGVVSISR
jgi:arylsulfatase A-like enzyme